MDSINKNAERERQEVFPCALSPELCATYCPDLSLTERRCTGKDKVLTGSAAMPSYEIRS